MTGHAAQRGNARIIVTVPKSARDTLHEVAAHNLRDPKREATRLLLDAIDRERARIESER